ncbi:hypothetical protein [Flavobacterium limnophilum]|uniref:hypothetical protein n=1 Tax=Flavobacterium limnophilum TaxID=3003262 RepID=UPI0024830A35|nr:hypothetical protein [Flavobacterium limnophilum]
MIHFYQQLGKLFYSVASVDGTVRKEEIAQLNEIVQKEWVPIETTLNEFGDDAAYQIEIVFDWLIEEDGNTGKVIPDLLYFKKEHPSLFTPQVNDLILKTAKAIANSFSEKNKSESVLIEKLRDVLYQEH